MRVLRSFAVLLTLLPCASAVAGCSGDQPQTNTPAVSASPSESAVPSAAPTVVDSAAPMASGAPTAGAAASGAPSAPAAPAHWSYTGDDGPAHWGDLSPDFAACKTGKNQSPIDIITKAAGTDKQLKAVDFNYTTPVPLRIFNNGHTVQVVSTAALTMTARGDTWKLAQFHFHSPSEHTIDGKGTNLELHFVHSNDAGELAVVGMLFKKGKTENKALKAVFDNIPTEVTQEPKAVDKVTVELAKVIPSKSNAKYYTYPGSLTTPKCAEGVRWYVLEAVGEVSDAQLQKFRAATKTDTNRPVMPVGDRKVMRP